MKKAIIVLAVLFLSGTAAQAHRHEGQQMPMMEHMKAHGMMMQDMMQMMADIVKMQKKLVEGMKPAEKKEALKELSRMSAKMDDIMAHMKDMMSQGMMMQGMTGGTSTAEPKKAEQKSANPLDTQEQSEAGVTARVSLLSRGGTMSFKVAFDTHNVELDKYKFEEIVALRAGGKEYKARLKSQEGSGHHRSAMLEFDNPGTKEFEVVIKGVAEVKERVFKFKS